MVCPICSGSDGWDCGRSATLTSGSVLLSADSFPRCLTTYEPGTGCVPSKKYRTTSTHSTILAWAHTYKQHKKNKLL